MFYMSLIQLQVISIYSLWDGSWETYFIVFSGSYVNQQLSVNSNDIYVLWIDDDENTLKLRQRDFAPQLPPTSPVPSKIPAAINIPA